MKPTEGYHQACLLDKKVWIKKIGLEHIQYNKANLSITVLRENGELMEKVK